MKEEHKQRFRENWEAVKKQHGELWEQTCAELKDDLMDGVGEGQSVMSKAVFCAFEARRSGQDDVADLMLALGWEFSANVPDQTPAAQDSAMRQGASSRLSASALFVLGFSWWFLL